VEKQMECRLAGETEVLGENLPQRHFCPSQNLTWPDSGLNPGRRNGKPATNRLSYGAAFFTLACAIKRWSGTDNSEILEIDSVADGMEEARGSCSLLYVILCHLCYGSSFIKD
jgi:hypothetical protein